MSEAKDTGAVLKFKSASVATVRGPTSAVFRPMSKPAKLLSTATPFSMIDARQSSADRGKIPVPTIAPNAIALSRAAVPAESASISNWISFLAALPSASIIGATSMRPSPADTFSAVE